MDKTEIKTRETSARDVYWGEFPEEALDKILEYYRLGRVEAAREMIRSLGREDFIFGPGRSDFLYYLPLDKTSRVLDVGCGLGAHSFNAARIAGEVWGCDLSKKRVAFCEARRKNEGAANVNFLHSDIEGLPFAPDTFDAIILNGVVEWLGEKNKNKDPRQDQLDDLRRLRSLLAPGGVMYIGIENRLAAAYLFSAKDHNSLKYTNFLPRFAANLASYLKRGKPYRTYTYAKKGYEHLLKDAGFDGAPDFYIAHPGYNLPQFLMPFEDLGALKFILNSMSIDKGTTGKLTRFLIKIPWLGGLMRNFFYSYVIFITK
ncbi:MAG: class I SAM-dependent methyltransferase [Candidatus Portnoybacteria bacterium]|nr:class I SAM-dependent methyltransferase [Candidatus Portnoybacteria bacterium]MDD4982495.1 class I SAM-dependent methyltransferase [Candidatus Portnoybacteria bacterium]